MKLKDFDFRIWNNNSKTYEAKSITEALGFITSVFNQLTYENSLIDYEIELWTGYKDCKRNKIYEGDILKDNGYPFADLLYKVVFKNGSFYLVDIDEIDENLMHGLPAEIEVIGNIHENKELLK
ncbi:hypothetical protein DU473_06730 [Campylobacter novaezeelandiae]|uniref:YopX protein domain-containing protein n=1 Tax=Campylobacter novaezeelandiae TaxID=2267891 RepID=A0A4Q9JTM6_9BACT|nr:YopX family protein [Campylobacter novaezeelandiae]TBR79842.1 hypothetical protein DU473_06730 [Campylobacter novaezeelandiae]